MKAFMILSCTALSACGMYTSHFDCPPGKGVGCKSVNEVLHLIVEKESGEDIFVADSEEALLLKQQEKKKKGQNVQQDKETLYLVKERSGDTVLVPSDQAKGSDR